MQVICTVWLPSQGNADRRSFLALIGALVPAALALESLFAVWLSCSAVEVKAFAVVKFGLSAVTLPASLLLFAAQLKLITTFRYDFLWILTTVVK